MAKIDTFINKIISETCARSASPSQVVFPMLYILFNIIYWLVYLYWLPDEVDAFVSLDESHAIGPWAPPPVNVLL